MDIQDFYDNLNSSDKHYLYDCLEENGYIPTPFSFQESYGIQEEYLKEALVKLLERSHLLPIEVQNQIINFAKSH